MKKLILLMLILTNSIFSMEFKNDEKLVSGQLKNGLKYYIYPNTKPSNFISVRLKVDAGSLYENPGDEGLAHFLEHLAFNGTEKYPKNDLIKTLESKGVSFGHDINAYTSFDETVFKLDGQNKDLNDFLDIMHQWAFKIKFTDNEVKKEKGVVIEEWRQNSGLNKEITDFYNKYIFGNTKYLDRMPIGKVPSIQNFTSAKAKAFYSKWYIPNNMSIYIAGDINDTKKIVNQLEILFGKEKSKTLVNTDILKKRKLVKTEKYDIFQNSEIKENSFSYLQIAPVNVKNQLEKIKADQLRILFSIAFNQRYAEKLNNLDTNLNGISITYSPFNDFFGFYELNLNLKNNKELAAIEEGFRELNQTKLGFLQEEFDEAKEAVISYYKSAAEEAKSQETSTLLSNIMDTDFDKYKYLNQIDYYEKAVEILNGLKLEDLNKDVKNYFSNMENYYLYLGYSKFSPEQLKNSVELGNKSQVIPYTRINNQGDLITKEILPGSITKEEFNKEFNYYTLTLSNGSKVYIKNSDYEKNSVEFYAVSKGGKSYLKTEDIPASNFISAVASSAPGTMDKSSYDRYLLSKTPLSLSYSLYDESEYFQGASNTANLNELLMNFYAFVTEPKLDETQLNLLKNSTLEWVKNRNNSKDTEFWNTYLEEYYLKDPRDALLTEDMINSVTSEKVLNVYKERFTNGIDYDYYIVGDIDYESLKQGIVYFLASLNNGKKEEIKVLDEKIRTNNIAVEKDLGKGEESTVVLHFGKKANLDTKSLYFKDMLKQSIDIELTKKLREEMSGVYGAYSSITVNRYYLDRADFSIEFTCDPKRVQELITAAKNVVENIMAGKISDETISLLKESYKSNYERNYLKNEYFKTYFDKLIFNEEQDLTPDEYNKLVTKENISKFLKDIYGGYEAKFILNPAKK